jgi:hypothetical protein
MILIIGNIDHIATIDNDSDIELDVIGIDELHDE